MVTYHTYLDFGSKATKQTNIKSHLLLLSAEMF